MPLGEGELAPDVEFSQLVEDAADEGHEGRLVDRRRRRCRRDDEGDRPGEGPAGRRMHLAADDHLHAHAEAFERDVPADVERRLADLEQAVPRIDRADPSGDDEGERPRAGDAYGSLPGLEDSLPEATTALGAGCG